MFENEPFVLIIHPVEGLIKHKLKAGSLKETNVSIGSGVTMVQLLPLFIVCSNFPFPAEIHPSVALTN
jgi:hypothetical protein